MLVQLRKLEKRVGVESIKGRAFHAFRRAIATALVEDLGISQAAQWIGDTPEVILRRYLKPTKRAQQQAASYVMNEWIEGLEWRPDGDGGDEGENTPSASVSGPTTSVTGPAGIVRTG